MDSNAGSFNVKSGLYAQSRPRYPRHFYEYLTGLTEAHSRLWDSACGNGQVAIDLADRFDEVYATDISENQIRNSFRHPKIKYFVLPSEKTPFPADFFDMICVAQALHWFNIPEFFTEAGRVLKAGGILAVFGYGFFSIDEETDLIIRDYFMTPIDEFWSERNQLIFSGFKGIDFPFLPVDTPPFTMDQKWSLNELLSFLDTWSAAKRYNETHHENIVDTLNSRLLPVWQPGETRTIRMDLFNFVRRK